MLHVLYSRKQYYATAYYEILIRSHPTRTDHAHPKLLLGFSLDLFRQTSLGREHESMFENIFWACFSSS